MEARIDSGGMKNSYSVYKPSLSQTLAQNTGFSPPPLCAREFTKRRSTMFGSRWNASIKHLRTRNGETDRSRVSHAGYTIVSGLARGVDTAAHQGAFQKGRTLSILGSGLLFLYPKENKPLMQAIGKTGGGDE